MRNNSLLDDCIKYFKNNNGFYRIFYTIKLKWQKYGKISGNIKIDNPTEDEKNAISGFMGKNFFDEGIKFSIKDFEKALLETKYREIALIDIIEGYFSVKLITNKEIKLLEVEKKKNFFYDIINSLKSIFSEKVISVKWIEDVMNFKKFGYNIIISEYEKSPLDIKKVVLNVCYAAEYLMINKGIRLAVLSANITLNPHYFDRKNTAGKLLIHILNYINNMESQSAEEILALYYMSGIIPDDISSFTVLYGISLYNKYGLHNAYEYFICLNESYAVTLSNLNNIVAADCKRKIVFIFENQMVFSHICNKFKDNFVSLICTSGQMKTASLILIDMLCKSNCILYYSGDIDPDGILIADKILLRHPDKIKIWRMTKEDYLLSLSEKDVSDRDIKKLDNIQSELFFEVLTALKVTKKAAYQELLIEYMINDIKSILKI